MKSTKTGYRKSSSPTTAKRRTTAKPKTAKKLTFSKIAKKLSTKRPRRRGGTRL